MLQITVDSEQQEGSFFKVRDFRVTPRTDLVEESYLGELTDDLDVQHHGFDGSFTVDNEDERTLSFLSNLIVREENHEAPSDIKIAVEYLYREPGVLATRVTYFAAVMKVAEQGIGGRKEYVQTSFEWKAKSREQSLSPN